MRLFSRLRTIRDLLAHFVARQRFFFVPLLIVVLLGGLLLALTSGLATVTPFVYTLF